MILKNSFNQVNEFFNFLSNQLRKIYLNSSIYNRKISKIDDRILQYTPSPSLLDCLIKYNKKKNKIEDYLHKSIWTKIKIDDSDYKKLHNFFWLFSIDLKSSNKITQSIISNWIDLNQNYNQKNWEVDILSKRIIAWISNSKLTYNGSNKEYKDKFNNIIKKQINHLINEIDRSEFMNDKMIGCSAVILSGLSYQNTNNYIDYSFDILKKIIKLSFDEDGFPKSRNPKQIIFYLKYFILIREWLKESQNDIPEYINEIIFYLGQAYNFTCQSLKQTLLFNGNNDESYYDFDKYLEIHGYKFKNKNNFFGGYGILKNKKFILAMDLGPSPEKKFSYNYQSGALSFEFLYNNRKIICNSGYFQKNNHQLNHISKSTATHSTLIIDNKSSVNFKKRLDGHTVIKKNLKILKKSFFSEKNYWHMNGSHDGYLKEYGIVYERKLEFFLDTFKLIGQDKLIKKRNFTSSNFEIRFHFHPETKITKTQDGKSILIELDDSGWKFICPGHNLQIETGLYFGNQNSYVENQNIYVSGITEKADQIIEWELLKIT
tara:strand:+ start:530 stop:2164 length:1635 start_codon:yes stop_codon:yes gene_type:complete